MGGCFAFSVADMGPVGTELTGLVPLVRVGGAGAADSISLLPHPAKATLIVTATSANVICFPFISLLPLA